MKTFAHDAPTWGPYAKQYPGAAAIVDRELGVRWDCSVFPAIYRGPVTVPCHRWDSGFNPVWALADLSAYGYEFELPFWRDAIRTDVAYTRVGGQGMAFRATLRNDGEKPRTLCLHLCAGLALPWIKNGEPFAGPRRLDLQPGETWIEGTGYRRMDKPVASVRDGLTLDATIPGERMAADAVNGFCFQWDATEHRGATVHYALPALSGGERLFARVRSPRGESSLNEVTLAAGDDWCWLQLPLAAGAPEFALRWTGGEAPEVDGLLVTPSEEPSEPAVVDWGFAPCEVVELSPHSRLLRYPGLDRWFGIACAGADVHWRSFCCAALDELLPPVVHNHVRSEFSGRGEGHFTNAFMHYIPVPAHGETVLNGVFATGTRAEVEACLADAGAWRGQAAERIAEGAARAVGETGRTRLAATLLTNIVYPTRRDGEWFAHRSPGKWWDCLYTWDSGFIGLGLLELDPALAKETLAHYLTGPDNRHSAFVQHGSMVPVQALLAMEIWNRTGDRDWLRTVLPGLRCYYRFFAGHDPRSRTARLASGLLQPWEYFYNSGGWDDYPAQHAMHAAGLAKRTAPMVTTVMAIHFARILRALEEFAGEPTDRVYTEDIGRFTEALQTHAWDEQEGIYGYVLHDAGGQPEGFFRHASGRNHNLGLDGMLPLTAGVAGAAQRGRLLEALFDPERFWSGLGLTTVDQSAPYYEPHGYWNGTVWLPYQWVMMKTLLDLGEGAKAVELAANVTTLWSESVESTGRCYEHFVVETRQGAGWHHFGGLSSPALCFYAALETPGRLTAGLMTRIETDETGDDGVRRLSLRREVADTPASLLLGPAVDEGRTPVVTFGGEPVAVENRGGVWLVTLPAGVRKGKVTITPAS